MIVDVNGRKYTINDIMGRIAGREAAYNKDVTLKQLFETLKYGMHVAVWINGVQVLKQDYPTQIIKDGDIIKIIKPLGGG